MFEKNVSKYVRRTVMTIVALLATQIVGAPILGLLLGTIVCILLVKKKDTNGLIFMWLVIFPAGFFSYFSEGISLKEVFSISVILTYAMRKSKYAYTTYDQKKLDKYIIMFLLFFFIYTIGFSLRSILLNFRGYEGRSIGNMISILIKGTIYYYSIYLVCRKMIVSNTQLKKTFLYAILVGCIIQSIGLLFSNFMYTHKLALYMIDFEEIVTLDSRKLPLWGLTGGVNTYAAFMSIILATIFITNIRIKYRLIFAILLFISILLTLSRSGIGALAIVLVCFILSGLRGNSNIKNLLLLIITGGFLYFTSSGSIDMLAERFTNVSAEMDRDNDMMGRAAILYEYINFMNSNPEYYFTGVIKELGSTFVPHNMFFTSIYYNGIIPLIFLILPLRGFYNIIKREHLFFAIAIICSFCFTEYFHSEIGEAFALLFAVCLYKDYNPQYSKLCQIS